MKRTDGEYRFYPTSRQIDAWGKGMWRFVDSTPYTVEQLDREWDQYRPAVRHCAGGRYVRFSPRGRDPFVAYWQPAFSTPAPLLVHTPGYGAEISIHPDLVEQGYSVLEVNPLGYVTENGAQKQKMNASGNWPVLYETIETFGRKGYRQWLADCMIAVEWALKQKEAYAGRVSFFGTSQGGGAALLLGSLFRGRGVRCVAADEPFLTNFPLGKSHGGAYGMVAEGLKKMSNPVKAWRTIGFLDTLSHTHRLDIPVLLTAGGSDTACMPCTIQSLFERLPSTRSFTLLEGAAHGYTQEFIHLAAAWFRMYA